MLFHLEHHIQILYLLAILQQIDHRSVGQIIYWRTSFFQNIAVTILDEVEADKLRKTIKI